MRSFLKIEQFFVPIVELMVAHFSNSVRLRAHCTKLIVRIGIDTMMANDINVFSHSNKQFHNLAQQGYNMKLVIEKIS